MMSALTFAAVFTVTFLLSAVASEAVMMR